MKLELSDSVSHGIDLFWRNWNKISSGWPIPPIPRIPLFSRIHGGRDFGVHDIIVFSKKSIDPLYGELRNWRNSRNSSSTDIYILIPSMKVITELTEFVAERRWPL
jgi:hypothetical protein